jgi:hypothetical protein
LKLSSTSAIISNILVNPLLSLNDDNYNVSNLLQQFKEIDLDDYEIINQLIQQFDDNFQHLIFSNPKELFSNFLFSENPNMSKKSVELALKFTYGDNLFLSTILPQLDKVTENVLHFIFYFIKSERDIIINELISHLINFQLQSSIESELFFQLKNHINKFHSKLKISISCSEYFDYILDILDRKELLTFRKEILHFFNKFNQAEEQIQFKILHNSQ